MRPSRYLIERIEAMERVIDFFATVSAGVALKEKQAVFLAQIDFWDWEMDNIVYACEQFRVRAQAWNVSHGRLNDLLEGRGFLTKPRLVVRYPWHEPKAVVAPFENLNRLVRAWNELLESAEKHCVNEKRAANVKRCDGEVVMPVDFRKEEVAMPFLPDHKESNRG